MALPLQQSLTLTDALALVATARPGVAFQRREEAYDDELVLLGGGEVLRLPLTPAAVQRQAVLVRALPRLQALVPLPLPRPRFVGLLADGATPFTAEARLPGTHPDADAALDGIARGQLEGLLAALHEVPQREAQQWGVAGDGHLRHGALDARALLVDAGRGVLTGVVGWRPVLGDPADDLTTLPSPLRPH